MLPARSTRWPPGSASALVQVHLLPWAFALQLLASSQSPFYGLRHEVLEDKWLDATQEKETKAGFGGPCGPAKEFGLYFECNEDSLVSFSVEGS